MESKLPVPTDNIFKFYALFSLLILIFSIGALIYVQQSTNELLFRSTEEVESLKQLEALTPQQEVRKALLERRLEISKADRGIYNKGLNFLVGISLFGIFYGFWKWHTDVQPVADQTAKVQLEIAKLQLEKLQAEVSAVRSTVGTP